MTEVTGFKVRKQRLFLHHRLVFTNTLKEVVVSFITFLQMLGRPLIVGHNIRRFDCRLLAQALDDLNLRATFQASASGFVDTLPLARELLRDHGLQSFGQENLVRELLGINYKAHDALEDVRALQTLYSFLQPSPDVLRRHTFTLDSMDSKPGVPRSKSPALTVLSEHAMHSMQSKRKNNKTDPLAALENLLCFTHYSLTKHSNQCSDGTRDQLFSYAFSCRRNRYKMSTTLVDTEPGSAGGFFLLKGSFSSPLSLQACLV
uniref:exodeoxyribonuclease III n=1 Tax=Cyprinodon variegatus TaxID=28743 RepID=A0A3Q2DNG0_CYPVA